MFHHSQLPAMPWFATSSVTANGVSAAKVVATILVPATHQGRLLPDVKYSTMLPDALREKYSPIPKAKTKYKITNAQSRVDTFIQSSYLF